MPKWSSRKLVTIGWPAGGGKTEFIESIMLLGIDESKVSIIVNDFFQSPVRNKAFYSTKVAQSIK